jgi:hypothetical protein
MPAIEPFSKLIGVNSYTFSKEEILVIEAELFKSICYELKEIFRLRYKTYFHLIKFSKKKEEAMLDANFARLIIQDILSTHEYDVQGIAYYTNTPQEVVEEVVAGINLNPTALFLRKIIELHRTVRADLYESIIKKIIEAWKKT